MRVFLLAACAFGALLFIAAPPWPDDWDGIGFVESIRGFDLAHFRPHPPGYPVYVALLRVAAAVARDPMRACALVGAVSGVLVVAFAYAAARMRVSSRSACLLATLVGVSPGVWRACSAVGSEAPALACLAVCAWGLSRARAAAPSSASVLGLGAGLGLGIRLSWAPLFVSVLALAPRGTRMRAWSFAAGGCALWAIPFLALVGRVPLVTLLTAHLSGHVAIWGGTVVTEPGAVRAAWLARDVFVDGLGVGSDPLGILVAVAAAASLVQVVLSWKASRWHGAGRIAVLVVPYLVWIALGQNLRDQPRHAVPIVALVAAALALAGSRSLGAFLAPAVLALLLACRSAADSRERRAIPPPGQQLVELARAQPATEALPIFGAASVRFFELSEIASSAHAAGSFGEVVLALTRMHQLPSRVWMTSELAGLDDPAGSLRRIATLCRPPRLDRRAPCLGVFEWKL